MKIYTQGWLHKKNEIGLRLLEQNGISIDRVYNSSTRYDQIHIFDKIQKFEEQDCTHIYGPHFYHFSIDYKYSENEYQNALSQWLVDLTMSIRSNVRCATLPFPVEVDKFTPSNKTGSPVIYFKNRDPSILDQVQPYFGDHAVTIKYGSYNEKDYLKLISSAPYCIWIGSHESQGFAFQEAMSCDTPIFVIDVNSLRDEWGSTVWKNSFADNPLLATSASYFNETCGLISSVETWKDDYQIFMSNLKGYAPRDFVLNNLSPQACVKTWSNLC